MSFDTYSKKFLAEYNKKEKDSSDTFDYIYISKEIQAQQEEAKRLAQQEAQRLAQQAKKKVQQKEAKRLLQQAQKKKAAQKITKIGKRYLVRKKVKPLLQQARKEKEQEEAKRLAQRLAQQAKKKVQQEAREMKQREKMEEEQKEAQQEAQRLAQQARNKFKDFKDLKDYSKDVDVDIKNYIMNKQEIQKEDADIIKNLLQIYTYTKDKDLKTKIKNIFNISQDVSVFYESSLFNSKLIIADETYMDWNEDYHGLLINLDGKIQINTQPRKNYELVYYITRDNPNTCCTKKNTITPTPTPNKFIDLVFCKDENAKYTTWLNTLYNISKDREKVFNSNKIWLLLYKKNENGN
jgi:hypothetical protein